MAKAEFCKAFDEEIYYGYIIRSDLMGALHYIKQFPEQAALYQRYLSVFDEEHYLTYEVDELLNAILRAYQQYYRDAFYVCLDKDAAAQTLQARLAALLPVSVERHLDEIEQEQVAGAFMRGGFHFLGGKTGGFYGPYIWKTTENRSYEVELPGGTQTYTVNILDGFIMNSWLDYLSFGRVSTGGWADAEGMINCVKSSYDFNSEAFRVSLLKHEAQHARDLAHNPHMSSVELEYRAKLVELIYSRERNLLVPFAREADPSEEGSSHSAAAHRIVSAYCARLGKNAEAFGLLSIEKIQSLARVLLTESESAL